MRSYQSAAISTVRDRRPVLVQIEWRDIDGALVTLDQQQEQPIIRTLDTH